MHLEFGFSIYITRNCSFHGSGIDHLPPMNPMGAGIMRSQNTGLPRHQRHHIWSCSCDDWSFAQGKGWIIKARAFFFLACIRSGYRHSPIAIVGEKRALSILDKNRKIIPCSVRARAWAMNSLVLVDLTDSQSARWPTTTNFWFEKKNNSPLRELMTIFSKIVSVSSRAIDPTMTHSRTMTNRQQTRRREGGREGGGNRVGRKKSVFQRSLIGQW